MLKPFRLLLDLLNEIYAIKLAFFVDHVVAFEFIDLARLVQLIESFDAKFEFTILHVLRVPVRYFVELKQVAEFHLIWIYKPIIKYQ